MRGRAAESGAQGPREVVGLAADLVLGKVDPVTGEPYGYEPSGERTYRLSATFAKPSDDADEPEWQRDGFFSHDAGRKSFEITVPVRTKR